MKNWFDIARPHEDIRRGDFDEAVFAADLGDVAAGRAAADYNDPYTFFRKTYLTSGLTNLLREVHEKLTTGKGPSVVELQTPFGIGSGTASDIVPATVKFGESLPASWIQFSEDIFLLTPERTRALKEAAKPEPVLEPEPKLDTDRTPPVVEPQPGFPELTSPDLTPSANDRLPRVALRASGIPSSKLADLSRGVFIPLSREVGEFTVTIEIDVRSAEGIPKKVIEQQVRETLRQLGASIQGLA